MSGLDFDLDTKTGRVYARIFKILSANPDGMRWTDLNKTVEEAEPDLHPKTINGCVWKLTEKYPDKVYKPKKGLFKLIKHSH